MGNFIEKILPFIPLWMTPRRKKRLNEFFGVMRELKREGKIEIYETYENGEWDIAIKPIN